MVDFDLLKSVAPNFLLFIGAIVSLIFIYALLLIVKNRHNNHFTHQRPKLCYICQESNLNCKIAYNKLYSTNLAQPSTRFNRSSSCARCGTQLSNNYDNKQGYGPSSRPQHHPIIFGKSKDLILVPEFVEEVRGGFNGDVALTKSDTFPQATTRVLTDEKGHSIKIRLASPPPQRQAELAKLHQQQVMKQQEKEFQAQGCVISLAQEHQNEVPTISSALSLQDSQESGCEHQGQSAALRRYLKTPEPSFLSLFHGEKYSEARDGRGPSSRTSEDNTHKGDEESGLSLYDEDQLTNGRTNSRAGSAQNHSRSSSSGSTLIEIREVSKRDPGRESLSTEQTPTESIDDTSAGEVECLNWDSRQDTSLDFCQSNFWQHQRELLSGLSAEAGSVGNDTVMDVDLRCANRLNLELLVMQNAALHNMMGVSPMSRRQSLFGPGVPASGVLPAASEQLAVQQQVAGQSVEQAVNYEQLITAVQRQLGIKQRHSIQQQQQQRTSCAESDSRRSSSSHNSQTFDPFGSSPSLRILVKPLRSNEAASSEQVEKTNPNEEPKIEETNKWNLKKLWSFDKLNSSSLLQIEEEKQEELFEVHLLEVRNLLQKSCDEIKSTGRRKSAEGLFARVFKRQDRELNQLAASIDGANQSAPVSRQQVKQVHSSRTSSLDNEQQVNKEQGLASEAKLGLHSAADFIQLPFVKITGQEERIKLSQLSGAYKFVCSSSELPLRISLYQWNKRTNARYTIGHCVVDEANFFTMREERRASEASSQEELEEGSCHESKRHSSLSTGELSLTARSSGSSEPKFVALPSASSDEQTEGQANNCLLLEYRLHQTILEAIS